MVDYSIYLVYTKDMYAKQSWRLLEGAKPILGSKSFQGNSGDRSLVSSLARIRQRNS